LQFSTFTGAVGSEAYTQRLIINSAGNVGIQTSVVNTGNALSVNGNVYVTGYINTSANVGIGTATFLQGNALTVFGGNIFVQGAINATGEITAYYSDARLKTNVIPITNAINLVSNINGVYYNANQLAADLIGEDVTKHRVGVIAQDVDAIMPEVVRPAPFDLNLDGTSKSGEHYITVQYERLVPLLVEAIKEQQNTIIAHETRILDLEKKITMVARKI
jgi:hypothetical protein